MCECAEMEGNLRPPELTGANYAYWKARTRIFLKAQGERVWRVVLTEWTLPTKPGATEGSPPIPKPEDEWTDEEINHANYNSKALNTICASMHEDQFTLIDGCESAKAAWDVFKTTYEGIASVKQSKLQLVNTDFELLRMKDKESIVEFHARVQELANRAIVLGEPFPQSKLVKKILRSLPQRFRMKVTDGWENKTVAQLMGSLQTYEMEILTDHSKKDKNIAFNVEECDSDTESDEIVDDPVVLLTKQFSKILKQVKQQRSGKPQNQKGSSSNNSRNPARNSNSNRWNTSSRTTQS